REAMPIARFADAEGVRDACGTALAIAELRNGRPADAWRAVEPPLAQPAREGDIGGLLLAGPAALQELCAAPWPADTPAEGLETLAKALRMAQALRPTGSAGPAAAG